jgi:hypothetical protein
MHPTLNLGRDDQLVASAEVLERSPKDQFATAGRVDVRGIKEVDPRFNRLPDQASARRLIQRPWMWTPVRVAEAQASENDTGNL